MIRLAHIAPAKSNIPNGRGAASIVTRNINEYLQSNYSDELDITLFAHKNSITNSKLDYLYPVELVHYEPFLNAEMKQRYSMILQHYSYPYLRKNDFDIFQVHNFDWSLIISRMNSDKNTVIRINRHLSEEERKLFNRFYHPKLHLVANSYNLKNTSLKGLEMDIKVIHNPIDTENIRLYSNKEKEDYFLYIGRITRNKGLDIALKACINSNQNIIVIGSLNKEKKDDLRFYDEIKQHLENPLVKHITSVEHNEVFKYMGKARATIFPLRDSSFEAFGNITVESMATGTPVITFNNPLQRELIGEENKIGFLLENEEEFIETVKNLPDTDPKLIRKRAEIFSTKSVGDKYLKLYKEIL